MSALPNGRFSSRAFVVVAAFGTLLVALFTAPQASYIDDTIAFLDGARRLANGAWLGRDFSSPIGPAAYFPTAFFVRVGFAPGTALSGDAAFWFALVTSLAWIRTRRWSDSWARWAFAFSVGLVAATPYRIGEIEWTHTTWALRYNAVGLALGALSVLEMCAPSPASRRSYALIGFYASFLFWLKITNVLCLAPLGVGLWACSRGERQRALLIAVGGAALTTLVIFLAAHFSAVGYMRDCVSMAATTGTSESGKLLTLMRSDLPVLLASLVIAALSLGRLAGVEPRGSNLLLSLANCFALVLALHLFASTKPLLLLPLLLAVASYHGSSATSPAGSPLVTGFAALAITPMVAVWLYCGAWTLRYARSPETGLVGLRIVRPPDIPAEGDARDVQVTDTRLPHDNYAVSRAYQDALELAHAHIKPDDTVVMADFTNVVSAAGLGRGLRGDWIAWHWKRNVGPRQLPWLQQRVPTAEWVFTWQMPPALARDKNAIVLDAIRASHAVAAESRWWTLWHRKPGVATNP